MRVECNDVIILPFKFTHAHVPSTRERPLTEQPVGFTANYEQEITQELTEAKNQCPYEAEQSSEHVVFLVLILLIPR